MRKTLTVFFERLFELSVFVAVFGVSGGAFGTTLQGPFFEKFILVSAAILAVAFAFVGRALVAGKLSYVRIPAAGIFGALVAVYGASAIFSDTPSRGLWGIFEDPFVGFLGIGFLAVFSFLYACLYSDCLFRATAFGLVLGNFFAALHVAGAPFPGLGMGDSFSAATSLLFGVFFIVTLLSEKDVRGFFGGVAQKIWIIFLFLVLGVSLFAVGKLFNENIWWPVCAGFGVMLLFALAGLVSFSRRSIVSVVVAVLFFTGVATLGSTWVAQKDSSSMDVQTLFRVAYDSFLNRPVLGYGPGRYEEAYALHFPKEINATAFLGKRFETAPGGVWEWASTIGSFGALLFVLLASGTAGVVWYALKNDIRSNNRNLLCFFSAFCALVPVLFFFAYDGVLLFYFFLFLGGLLGIVSRRNVWTSSRVCEKKLHLDPRYVPAAFLFGLFVVGASVFFEIRLGGMMSAGVSAHVVSETEDFSIIADRLERAARRDASEPEYDRRLGETYVGLAVAESLKENADGPTMERLYNLAFKYAVEANKKAPYDIQTVESLARVYEAASATISSATDLAIDQYAKAEALEPNNPLLPFHRGVLLLKSVQNGTKADEDVKKKKLQDAVDALNTAIDRGGNFPAAFYQLALVRREQKDIPRAIEIAQKAVASVPNDASSLLLLASLYLEDKDTEKAGTVLERAKLIAGNDPALYLYYGKWYAAQDKKDEAKAAYQKAQSLLPDAQKSVKDSIDQLIKDLDAKKETPDTVEAFL